MKKDGIRMKALTRPASGARQCQSFLTVPKFRWLAYHIKKPIASKITLKSLHLSFLPYWNIKRLMLTLISSPMPAIVETMEDPP